jgi:hypothetical protein
VVTRYINGLFPKNKFGMQKILLLLTTLIFLSCHCDLKKFQREYNRVPFKDYFNDIKKSNLPNELYGYSFMSLRGINYEMRFPDSLIVIFDHNKCKIKITNCRNFKNSSLKTFEEIRNKTIKTLEKLLQFKISLLDTDESQFRITIEKEIFEQNTLPFYETKNTGNPTNVVLVYLYEDGIRDTINDVIFNYYKPVRIDKNWFYYLDEVDFYD